MPEERKHRSVRGFIPLNYRTNEMKCGQREKQARGLNTAHNM